MDRMKKETQEDTMYYIMRKYDWAPIRGGYSIVTERTPRLSLEQVRAWVARLPDTTRHFWHIDAYSVMDALRVGGINADEFDGEVPEFSE